MTKIEITDSTREELQLLAAAWDVEEGQAVAELIHRFRGATKAKPVTSGNRVPIHTEYRGVRVEGEYDRKTKSVTVGSGDLAGQKFPKPSPAARAVVASIAPDVNPHRNGWKYWIVTETDEPLQSIRYM